MENFLKDVNHFGIYPDNIQLYFILNHYMTLMKKVKGNKASISFEEIVDYYDYLKQIQSISEKVLHKKNVETAKGYLSMIFLEFLKFFTECERMLSPKNEEEQNITVQFQKEYKMDADSHDFHFPILHIKIIGKLWYDAQAFV